MGWITTQRAKGTSHKDFFQQQIGGSNLEIIDAASKGSVCYMAAKTPEGVIAVLAQFHWAPNAGVFDGNFGYKTEEESAGPYRTECPERILNLLSPLKEVYSSDSQQFQQAKGWRESCWRWLFETRAKSKVAPGDVVRFSKPIVFQNEMEGDTFVFVKRSTFLLGQTKVRITNWRSSREYEVIEKASS